MKSQSNVVAFEGQGKSEKWRQTPHAFSLSPRATQNTILDILGTGAARG